MVWPVIDLIHWGFAIDLATGAVYITNRSVIKMLIPAFSPSTELSPHKRERRKEARPQELLDAALSLFVEKGFAATNIVLGVGSFTYQINTRDTLGFAAKGAWF